MAKKSNSKDPILDNPDEFCTDLIVDTVDQLEVLHIPDNSDSFESPSFSTNAVYRMSFRWTNLGDRTPNFEDVDSIRMKLSSICSNYIFQLERTILSDGSNNDHYQGFLNLKEKIRPKTLARSLNSQFFGIELQHCHDELSLKTYSMKPDSRISGPWADKKIYLGADLMNLKNNMYHWQKLVMDYLAFEPDDRTIVCIIDIKGNTGKSKFSKYISFFEDSMTLNFGDARDLLNLISKNSGKRSYIFDLTRSRPSQSYWSDLFCVMEQLKNGHFVNTKYETNEVLMDPPHIVMFCNEIPHVYGFSQDRWRFFCIDNQMKLRSLTLFDVISLYDYQKDLHAEMDSKPDPESGRDKLTYPDFVRLLTDKMYDLAFVRTVCTLSSTGDIISRSIKKRSKI